MRSYTYRRKLTKRELLPALGAGAGAGLGVAAVVAYLTQIFLRREPLVKDRGGRPVDPPPAPEHG